MKDMMLSNVFGSATKIVFILVALALIFLTIMGKIEAKDFMVLATMVFSAYYSNNRTSANNEKQEKSDSDQSLSPIQESDEN